MFGHEAYIGSSTFRPPGLPGRELAAGGNSLADAPPWEVGGVAEALVWMILDQAQNQAQLNHALGGISRALAANTFAKTGTYASINRECELDVYLARGCDAFRVEVGKGWLAKTCSAN